MLYRECKGRQIRVLIVSNGFEYEGQLYKSRTAVANATNRYPKHLRIFPNFD